MIIVKCECKIVSVNIYDLEGALISAFDQKIYCELHLPIGGIGA